MNRAVLSCAIACTLAARCHAGPTFIANPDGLPLGMDLTNQSPGLSLSVTSGFGPIPGLLPAVIDSPLSAPPDRAIGTWSAQPGYFLAGDIVAEGVFAQRALSVELDIAAAGGGPGVFTLHALDQFGASIGSMSTPNLAGSAWQPYTLTVSLPNTDIHAFRLTGAGQGLAAVEEIRWTVPAPGSAVALALAMAAARARRRRS